MIAMKNVPVKIHEAIDFYTTNGFRAMPIFSVDQKCKHRPYKPELDCKGQCWGKVPMFEHWPDKEIYTKEDFPENSNLALIMGRQLDGRWFVGFDIDGELDLMEFFMELPETLECKTNRGRHLIYQVNEDTPLGNWNDLVRTRSKSVGYRSGYKGALDIKYCRGAMVSPPSLTKNNTRYEWLKWMQPVHLPPSEVNYIIRKRKFSHPKVKRYRKWSEDPTHIGKKP